MGRSWVGAGVKEVTWRAEVSGILCISYSQTFECFRQCCKRATTLGGLSSLSSNNTLHFVRGAAFMEKC